MSGKRILIVDDEPYLIRSLSFVLRKEGYQVESAIDGLEALEKVKLIHPHLVFLDLHLPKMDGFEACKKIKSDPDLQQTYVILLTAKGQEADRKKGMAAGANEYLTKPFSPKDLVAHLRGIFSP